MKLSHYLLAACLLPVALLAAAPTTPPATTQTAAIKPASRLWNLQDADILSVINEVSQETGKNFVVDPRVTGKISLISSKPIKPNEVYNVFLSVLGILGYSAIPNGNVVKIVPNMESSELASRVATAESPGKGDEVVVRVIPLENISAVQLIPTLRPLLPQWSNIAAYTPGNVLILLGRASNLTRIAEIIRNVDQASSNNIDIIPLHQASAAQVAGVLSNLQNAAKANGEGQLASIAADERSNSVLISGNKTARLKLRVLVSQLDTPNTHSPGNTSVVYLRYLEAKTLAPILGKIAQNITGIPVTNTTNTNDIASAKTTAAPTNQANIQAEPNTNALVITAPPALMSALSSVVAKLDIRPAQVLVEAIIVEVSQNDLKNLGIQWGGLSSTSSTTVTANSTATSVASASFTEGVIGIIPHTPIQAILSILENKTSVDILSTPSVVVLDNQKATLTVGQEVPQETGSYATTGSSSTVTPFTTIANKPVVLKLIVTPQINLGQAVRLKIKIQNDSLQNPDNPGLTPLINTSMIENAVIINSDDVLVLGGLTRNNISENVDKIPILGDLPVIGAAFRHKQKTVEKKNLMVFIKPIILHNKEEVFAITSTKYDYIRNTQINSVAEFAKPIQQEQNVLPRFKEHKPLPKPFESAI